MAQESIRWIWIGRETTEGTLAGYLKAYPVVDFKPDAKDERFVPKELQGTRIRERKAVRVKKHTDLSFKVFTYYDLAGWLLLSAMQAPTITTNGSAGTAAVYTLTNTGTAGSYTLTIDGYTTIVNAHNVANATLQTNIRALPSIAASNATVAGTPGTSQTITLAATLANYNLPSISIDTSLITSGTLTLARTTATAQSYNHQYRAGGSGMPTLSIVYYDGVSVKQYLGCSIDQLDFAFSVDKAIEIDVKAIARMETDSTTGLVWSTQTASATAITPGQQQVTMGAATDNVTTGTLCYVTNNDGSTNPEFVTVQSVATGNKLVANFTLSHDASWKLTPLKVPQLSIAAYNQPVDPQQVASITIGGVSNANLINAKITLKQNRNAFWTIQPGADMKRATEGEVSCAFDAQFDYSAYAGSQYKTYIDNTAPGAIVFTYQDTTSIAGTKVPKLVWTLPNPIITDGNLNSMSPSVAAQIKGMGALDTTTNTNLQVDLTNEEYQYITRA